MDIDTDQLKAALDSDILILDCRRDDELETYGKLEAKNWAHIPHVQTQAAFELSDEAFQTKYLVDKPKKDDLIYLHCKVGGRSGMAQQTLIGLGYTNTRNYPGGFDRWLKETS